MFNDDLQLLFIIYMSILIYKPPHSYPHRDVQFFPCPEIANKFNAFFMNKGPNNTKDQSYISYNKHINNSILSSFNFQLIDDDVLKKP